MSRLGYKPKDSTSGKLISSLRQEILTLTSNIKKLTDQNKQLKDGLNKVEKQVGGRTTRFS